MPGRKLPIVGFSWDEMWRLLKSQPPTAAGTATNVVVPGTTRSQDLQAASAIRDRRPHRAHDLGAVGQGRSAALLNVCLDRNYQERDSNIALMADPAIGRLDLDRNRDKAGAVFFLAIENYEGEFAVGLGRICPDELEDPSGKLVHLEWFERKSKLPHWGKRPAFKLAITGYTRRRVAIPWRSGAEETDFLPVEVGLVASSEPDEPVLSEHCMQALRTYIWRDRQTLCNPDVAPAPPAGGAITDKAETRRPALPAPTAPAPATPGRSRPARRAVAGPSSPAVGSDSSDSGSGSSSSRGNRDGRNDPDSSEEEQGADDDAPSSPSASSPARRPQFRASGKRAKKAPVRQATSRAAAPEPALTSARCAQPSKKRRQR